MAMMIVCFVVAAGLAGYLVIRRQAESIKALCAELEAMRSEGSKELEEARSEAEKLDKENEKLDRENFRLLTECNMRKEYAYVCRDCRQSDQQVQNARNQHLRSVTGPKR